MAIKIKRGELEKLGAKIHELPSKTLKVSLHTGQEPEPDNLVATAVSALVAATNEQRAAILLAVSANEQIAAALSTLKRPEGWNGNWDVHITKRDALGRISEVQFRPAKP
jgi:hypothetical protein